jgi:hypothetical protein
MQQREIRGDANDYLRIGLRSVRATASYSMTSTMRRVRGSTSTGRSFTTV